MNYPRRATTLPNYRFLVTGGAGFIGSTLVRHPAGLSARAHRRRQSSERTTREYDMEAGLECQLR